MLKRLVLPCLVALLGGTNASAQLVVNGTQTAQQLVQNVLLGGGVTAFNVQYNGVLNPPLPQVGSGSFTANGTNLGLASGVLLSTGTVANAVGPATNFSGDMN
ncbi:MAG: choice-of-anchor L domain-containing protein, partial [Flavobacteriales bacterium]